MQNKTALLGWAAALGTLPYLTLKAIWLTGGTAGVRTPALLALPSVVVLNGVTVLLDLFVVGLAMALTHPWGQRLPAWLVLLPLWVGTGFLLPMALVILPTTLAATAAGAPSAAPLQPWVQPLVYGGFAWQGGLLTVAFVGYAARRWGSRLAAPPAAADPVARVIVSGGAVLAGLSALLHVASGVSGGQVLDVLSETGNACFAGAGAAGAVALVRGTRRRWPAAASAWAGSGAMFSWGLWSTALTTSGTVLAAPDPLAGPAALTGLLGGFALAAAALLAVATPRVCASCPGKP